MSSETPLSRRTALKTLGGAAAAAATGVTGLAALGGGATATGDLDLSEPVVVESNDGTVEYVAIYGDSVVNWQGLDEPAAAFTIEVEARIGSDEYTQLHLTDPVDVTNDSWGNYDENIVTRDGGREGEIHSGIGLDEDGNHDPTIDWHIVGTDPDDYGLPSRSLSADRLTVDEDGATETYTVSTRNTYRWYETTAAEAAPLLEESFESSFEVEVHNIAAQSSTSDGSGNDGATAQ